MVSLGTVMFRNTAVSDFHCKWPVPQRSGSEAIIQPSLCSTRLPCPAFQGTLAVQLRSGLQCTCGTSPGNASAPSSVLRLPNVTRLPHLKRQGSWGCYIFLFSSRYQQLQELWPLTSCQKGLQPAHSWPGLEVTWLGSHLTRSRTSGL